MENSINTGFICSVCNKPIYNKVDSISTGYATNKQSEKICFSCCGDLDKKVLTDIKPGYIRDTVLYYDGKTVCNWCNTLSIQVHLKWTTKHNWGLKKHNFEFYFGGARYYGYVIGENTQVATIRKCKG